jgi:hypothetical protein
LALFALPFVAVLIFAQQPPSSGPPYLIQTRLVRIELPSGWSDTCFAVFPDGRFHLERSTRSTIDVPRTEVYEAALSVEQLQLLAGILSSDDFENLAQRDDRHRIAVDQGEAVLALIPRREGLQSFFLVGLEGSAHHESHPLPPAVQPLVKWIETTTKEIKKAKIHPASDLKPVSCWLPRRLPIDADSPFAPGLPSLNPKGVAAEDPPSPAPAADPPKPQAQNPPAAPVASPQADSTQKAAAPSTVEPANSIASVVNLPLPDLVKNIPELRGIQPPADPHQLNSLLEKVGDAAETLFHKMPNLISHEQVEQSQNGGKATRQQFDYLILSRRTETNVTLDEYRVDLNPNTGSPADDINPAAVISGGAAALANLERRSMEASTHNKNALPLSQGFANQWIYFYPANRPQATFRYLGDQRLNGHRTYVIAFAQIPSAVLVPAELHFNGKSYPIYYQGIAWVEDSGYRIVHLWTDLLAPLNSVHLQRLVSKISFGESKVTHGDPLWLPQKVDLSVVANGQLFQEQHTYSDYRIYGVDTKITY